MANKRLDWQRTGDMRATATVGDVEVTVWRDTDMKKGFIWELYGAAPHREAAFDAAEKAVLGAISLPEGYNAEWLKDLTKRAHEGTAYLMVGGVKRIDELLLLCKLATEGIQRIPVTSPPPKMGRRRTKKKEVAS